MQKQFAQFHLHFDISIFLYKSDSHWSDRVQKFQTIICISVAQSHYSNTWMLPLQLLGFTPPPPPELKLITGHSAFRYICINFSVVTVQCWANAFKRNNLKCDHPFVSGPVSNHPKGNINGKIAAKLSWCYMFILTLRSHRDLYQGFLRDHEQAIGRVERKWLK